MLYCTICIPCALYFMKKRSSVPFYTFTKLFLISPGLSVIPSPSKTSWKKKKKNFTGIN